MEEQLLDAIRRRDLAAIRTLATRDLIDGVKTDGEVESDQSPLVLALELKFVDVAELLLELGADLGARNFDGEAPLQAVLWFDEPLPALEWLLSKGVNPNSTLRKAGSREPGDTTLHCAARWSSGPVVERLLAAGADVHRRDEAGATPLHLAAEALESSAVRQMLEKGASASAVDEAGRTPLHRAVKNYKPYPAHGTELSSVDELRSITSALLARGASVETVSKDGLRAWDLARSKPVPGDLLERIRPKETSTPLGDFVLPGVLTTVFGFMGNAGLCVLAKEAFGVEFEGLLVNAPRFPAFLETALLSVAVPLAAVPVAASLDARSRTPRKAWLTAVACLLAVSVGGVALSFMHAPVMMRGLLSFGAAFQVGITGVFVGRALQPDRLDES